MFTPARTAALLLLLSATGLAPALRAQSCAEEIRRSSSHPSRSVVSVAELRIPPGAWQHFDRALIANDHGQPEILDRELALAFAAAPNFARAHTLRALAQLRSGHPAAALDSIAAAREVDPRVAWSGIIAASALNQLGRFDEAVAELDRTGGTGEFGSWQENFERSRAEVGRRHVDAALHASALAVAGAPVGCTDVRLVRAGALQLAGRLPEAAAEIETYIALDRLGTRRAQARAILGEIRKRLPEPDIALLAPATTPAASTVAQSSHPLR